MACGTYTVKNVPQSELDEAMAIWRASQPTPQVTSQPDGGGTFTVTAVFPPCPPNTTHSTD